MFDFPISFKRRIVQVVSLLLLNASWGPQAKWICSPVMQCHACPLSWFACPIGVFIHYSGYHIFPFLAAGMVLLIGILLGRLLCGWVCPFGFLQDMLYKIPSPKIRLPKWTNSLKYVFLLVTVFALPWLFGAETWYSFCRICPTAAIQTTIPALVTGGIEISTSTAIKLSILLAVVVLAIISSRSFCRIMCPIGALLAPLNLISYWIVRNSKEKCTACRRCANNCPTDVKPMKRIVRGIPVNRELDCVVCHDCQQQCPPKAE